MARPTMPPVGGFSNYAQLQRLMVDCHAVTEPAEAHGTLAGALCAAGGYRLEDWLAEILPEGADSDSAAVPGLRGLYDESCAALAGTQMQFQLLLPDDDAPLEERTEALTLWCNGFIYGLGTSGAPDPARCGSRAASRLRCAGAPIRHATSGSLVPGIAVAWL